MRNESYDGVRFVVFPVRSKYQVIGVGKGLSPQYLGRELHDDEQGAISEISAARKERDKWHFKLARKHKK